MNNYDKNPKRKRSKEEEEMWLRNIIRIRIQMWRDKQYQEPPKLPEPDNDKEEPLNPKKGQTPS
ncbi:MAG TPA: hypothetical protein PLG20_04820 [Candidatus Syntrophosphaera sp.]|jgi:hypothetical protein|nr:hypothetical protein [Candidatus Syntrophosphaera sp.]